MVLEIGLGGKEKDCGLLDDDVLEFGSDKEGDNEV